MAVSTFLFIISFTAFSVFDATGGLRTAMGLLALIGYIVAFFSAVNLWGFWPGFSVLMAGMLFFSAIMSFFTGELVFDIEVNVWGSIVALLISPVIMVVAIAASQEDNEEH